MVFRPNVGLPKFGTSRIARSRIVSANGNLDYLPGGMIIDGAKTRDPFNSDISSDSAAYRDLRPGLLLGKVTASGKLANWAIGALESAIVGTDVTITLTTAQATELVRRIGSTGSFKLTGPPSAAGTVRQATVTYSAVNTGTGAVTVTAIGVNEVQTITFNAAATGGNYVFRVPIAGGTMEATAAIAWNATDATLLSNIQTALDNATGVVNGIVVSGAAPDTALTFTFSGTGFAGNTYANIEVLTYPTTPTSYTVARTTEGVAGAFVAGSIVSQADGSEFPITFVPDDWGEYVPEDSADIPLPRVPLAGMLIESQLVPWPADTSLRTWIRDRLNVYGKFSFAAALNA